VPLWITGLRHESGLGHTCHHLFLRDLHSSSVFFSKEAYSQGYGCHVNICTPSRHAQTTCGTAGMTMDHDS